MKYIKILINIIWFFSCFMLAHESKSQSVAVYGGSDFNTVNIASGGTHISTEEYMYIGSGTYEINGTWEIYSKNIAIDHTAIITGSGSIQFFNPLDAGRPASRTFIDGNGSANAIVVNVVLNNSSGLELNNIDFPAELLTLNFTNNTASSTYMGKDLNLAVDDADIWLDSDALGDLRFGSMATISNYSVDRMIITNNSIISHVVRDAGGTEFFFPVGIADGDYTPANIVGANMYKVSVQDYSASAATVTDANKGMDRTWHVFGGTATSVALHHNQTTNGSTFSDPDAFITRYLGDATWSTGTPEQTSLGVHTNNDAIASGIPTAGNVDASYLTKMIDLSPDLTPIILLPINNFDIGTEREFIVQLSEVMNTSTTAPIAFNITVPPGYLITFDGAQTHAVVASSGTHTISNSEWNVVSSTASTFDFQSKAGFSIDGTSNTKLGFKITRTSAVFTNSSAVIIVNIYPDAEEGYDSNNANNVYSRIVTAY